MSLTVTQRWYVRRRWLEGESIEALAADYGVEVGEVREETERMARRAQAAVAVKVPQREPESGLRCTVCRTHRYGIGESMLDPDLRLMLCYHCNRRTPHRRV